MITIEQVTIPSFGEAAELPAVPVGEYEARLAATVDRMTQAGLDALVVYGDREHCANIAFLAGFDPRFEEAVLLLDARGQRVLIVGNECLGYLPDPALRFETILFQEFSLMGQPRDRSQPLRTIFADFGIGKGTAVGCVGWKYFEGELLGDPEHAIEIPSFIVDLLRHMTGDTGLVRNANRLFMNPRDGLRVTNSPDQIARFEFAATRTSESVKRVIENVREGVAENELEVYLRGDGLPLSCHPMIGFGAKAKRGLASPSENTAKLGDAFTVAFGVQGALTCRAGAVARGPEDLSRELREFYPRFVANYFQVVACWYERVKVGARAGEVYDAVDAARDPALFDFAVNPGHYIHLDEWVHSPFERGGTVELRPAMALQMDIIPVSRGPFCYANAEDGLILADEALRAEIASRYPDCWKRIQARQAFMREVLGIDIHESVLPLSNTPAWLAPYALAPHNALVKR